MTISLLETARSNRITALETLVRRKSEAELTGQILEFQAFGSRHVKKPVFTSCRVECDDDRIAA